MMERWPQEGQAARPLRNLPALPDQVSPLLSAYILTPTKMLTLSSQIGTFENPLYILAWRKLEPSSTWDDIIMRMANVRTRPVNGNVLSMRISRMMDDYMIIFTWRGTKDWFRPSGDQKRRFDKLDQVALAKNSTRRFTPGLCYPELGEAGGRVPVPIDHRKRSRGSYHKTFVRKAPRASRAVAAPNGAAKKRKAAVKEPKTKNLSLLVKLPVRGDVNPTKGTKNGYVSPDGDDMIDDDMTEDDMNEDETEEDVDEDPSSRDEDEDLTVSADEETVFSTPEKRAKTESSPLARRADKNESSPLARRADKNESSPLARRADTQSQPSHPFARPVDNFDSGEYGSKLNHQYDDPYELSHIYSDQQEKHIGPRNIYQPVMHIDPQTVYQSVEYVSPKDSYQPMKHIDPRNMNQEPKHINPYTIFQAGPSYIPPFSAPQPVEPFTFGRNTSVLEDPFQATYPTRRMESHQAISRASYHSGLNFAPRFAHTVPSNDFNYDAVDPSLAIGRFGLGNNNITANDSLREDAPHDKATDLDYAHDTYWYNH